MQRTETIAYNDREGDKSEQKVRKEKRSWWKEEKKLDYSQIDLELTKIIIKAMQGKTPMEGDDAKV